MATLFQNQPLPCFPGKPFHWRFERPYLTGQAGSACSSSGSPAHSGCPCCPCAYAGSPADCHCTCTRSLSKAVLPVSRRRTAVPVCRVGNAALWPPPRGTPEATSCPASGSLSPPRCVRDTGRGTLCQSCRRPAP